MTVDDAKSRLVAWADAQIGTHEGPNNRNPYAETEGLARLYGWNVQNQPWCDVFVDAGFITCFGYDLGSAMTYQFAGCSGAACAQSAAYYRANGAWYDTPQVGDQVFFLVGNGINHTGLVTHVGMGAITTVEGNSSDMVTRRGYAIGSPQIAGYGRPRWELVEGAETPDAPDDPVGADDPGGPQTADSDNGKDKPEKDCCPTLPVLREGDVSEAVRNLQRLLIARGYYCGGQLAYTGKEIPDGDFGPATREAVEQFQSGAQLPATGEVEAQTWAAILTQ